MSWWIAAAVLLLVGVATAGVWSGAFAGMQRDIVAVLKSDPAAQGWLEVALLYPGVQAVWSHRVAHALWRRGFKFSARWLSIVTRFFTGVDIHPAAELGSGVFIDHGMGVVIGETAQVGDNCTLYHGVTLGGTGKNRGKRHPTLGHRVTVGAGAKVLGAITVGNDARIGANAVVLKAVPDAGVVVGVPAAIVKGADQDYSI